MRIAMDLFLTQGFEDTTVEQIATAAGMSRRSYFRYFSSKDEVFAEGLVSIGQRFAALLADRPATDAPWVALRRSFDPLLAEIEGDDRAMRMSRMMLESPTLQGSHLRKQVSWQSAIASALESRLGSGGEDSRLRANALAGAALSCLNTAQSQWVLPGNDVSLGVLLDTAMNAVHPLSDTTS